MSVDKIPQYENFPAEKEQSKLVRWIKDKIYQPIAYRINFLLSLVNSGFVEIPGEDPAQPGDDGNWRWKADGSDLVLQNKVSGVWTDTAIKNLVLGDIVLEKASGRGIKVDLTSPTFGFADILGEPTGLGIGGNEPAFNTYRDTVGGWQFSTDKEMFRFYHIPHDYVPGSDIFLHIHWSHTSASVTGGTITFEVESSYAKGHDQAAFPATVTGTFIGTASATQFQHILTEVQLSSSSPVGLQIITDDLEPDGVILMRIKHDANNMTGAQPDPFIHYADIHYQTNSVTGTKQKAPPFYT